MIHLRGTVKVSDIDSLLWDQSKNNKKRALPFPPQIFLPAASTNVLPAERGKFISPAVVALKLHFRMKICSKFDSSVSCSACFLWSVYVQTHVTQQCLMVLLHMSSVHVLRARLCPNCKSQAAEAAG